MAGPNAIMLPALDFDVRHMLSDLKENPTLIVIALDCSTSMRKSSKDVLKMYNDFLEQQKTLSGTAFVALVKFSARVTKVFDPQPIASAEPLTEKDYQFDGGTALNDTIVFSILAIDRLITLVREKTGFECRIVFPLITDGWERGSQMFPGPSGAQDASDLVKLRRAQGWTILFNGVGLSQEQAYDIAKNFGIPKEDTLYVTRSARGLAATSEHLHLRAKTARLSDHFE